MRFMKFKNLLLLAHLTICFTAAGSAAQILPTIEGSVDEKKPSSRPIPQAPRGSTKVLRVTNGVLFVLADPPDAKIMIDNKPRGRAVNGEFRAELPAGRRYVVQVEGDDQYSPFKKSVMLPRRGYEIVRAALSPRYGQVQIGPAIEGAKLFIDDQPADPRAEMDKESNTLKINKLEPGEHKITYRHPDFVPLERRFKVSAGSQYIWTYDPARATAELTVVTDPGAAVYVDGALVGNTPADGMLKSEVRLGESEVKIVKDDYEEFKQTAKFEFRKPVRIEQRLTPVPTSGGFAELFDATNVERWVVPAQGWAVRSGRLYIEKAGAVGYPGKIRYRGFTMVFHLKLENSGGAAWALRIKDPNNYYLFFLCGPDGPYPNRFVTYIVRDGKMTLQSSDEVLVKMAAGNQYRLEIRAEANKIEHKITPADTGKAINLGFFEDVIRTFPYGNICFRTVGMERFSVDDIYINPL
jgi:hypothetical protein